jgi:hypothetical protein
VECFVRVAIVGSRNARQTSLSWIASKLPEDCHCIISGGAVGIDSLAEKLARMRGIPFIKYVPDYRSHGRRAPLIRNEKIIAKADLVLAFWDFHSRGTAFTIVRCLEKQIPVRVYRLRESVE